MNFLCCRPRSPLSSSGSRFFTCKPAHTTFGRIFVLYCVQFLIIIIDTLEKNHPDFRCMLSGFTL